MRRCNPKKSGYRNDILGLHDESYGRIKSETDCNRNRMKGSWTAIDIKKCQKVPKPDGTVFISSNEAQDGCQIPPIPYLRFGNLD